MGEGIDFEKIANRLWEIIDDIDTVDDWAKTDDKAYRNAVVRLQKERYQYGSTDGYSVTWRKDFE